MQINHSILRGNIFILSSVRRTVIANINPHRHRFSLHFVLFRRPCMIWSPYGGHCNEKSLVPTSKYIDTPKIGETKCLGHTFLMILFI